MGGKTPGGGEKISLFPCMPVMLFFSYQSTSQNKKRVSHSFRKKNCWLWENSLFERLSLSHRREGVLTYLIFHSIIYIQIWCLKSSGNTPLSSLFFFFTLALSPPSPPPLPSSNPSQHRIQTPALAPAQGKDEDKFTRSARDRRYRFLN